MIKKNKLWIIALAVIIGFSITGCKEPDTSDVTDPGNNNGEIPGDGNGNGAKSSAKAITAFSFANPAATGTINEAEKTINLIVPYETNCTSLVPTITHTGVSISPASGVAQNFNSSVTYTVTAEDGSTAQYMVTVTVSNCTDHEPGSAATCTTPQTCAICGVQLAGIDPTNHNYENGVCTRCGVIFIEDDNLDQLEDILDSKTGGTTANDFITVTLAIDIGDMKANSGWDKLLTALNTADKFVSLDLSECTMEGTAFDPRIDSTGVNTATTAGKDKIVSLILPTVAESIAPAGSGDVVFRHFTVLTHIEGAEITEIGANAFGYSTVANAVTSLKTVSFPNVTSIGNSVFRNCSNLESIEFPMVQTIGETVFENCSKLVNGAYFSELTNIGAYTFRNCTGLESISFPKSTTVSIFNPFMGCTNLTNFDLIGSGSLITLEGGKALANTSGSIIDLRSYPSATGSISLSTVTNIEQRAFGGCTGLTNLDIQAVTNISHGIFAQTGIGNLSIILGETAPTVGQELFISVTSKTVIIQVPTGATGYGTLPETYSGSDQTVNWGNGFRGAGWNGMSFENITNLNSNITLKIIEICTDHTAGNAATCTTQQTCTYCGEILAPVNPTNHRNDERGCADCLIVNISLVHLDTAAAIQNAINTALARNDISTVPVTGERTDLTSTLSLNIPAGKSVEWDAEISGTADPLISLTGTGTFNITDGEITAATNRAIINNSTGVINISGGTITSEHINGSNGTIVLNQQSVLNITDGTVSHTGSFGVGAIRINNNGEVNISGGVVSAESGLAITVSSAAANTSSVINISGGTVTSANENGVQGTILFSGQGTLNITGGTVTNTATNVADCSVLAIRGVAEINISGGTVSAISGMVINVASANTNGVSINISQAAGKATLITSAINSNSMGTIRLSPSSTNTLNITGGRIENTSNNANATAIQNYANSTVDVSGDGKVKNNGIQAIRNTAGVTISGNAEVDGFPNPYPPMPVDQGFNITFEQIKNEAELMPWDATGGLSIPHTTGSSVTLTLTSAGQYGDDIRWRLDGAYVTAKNGESSYTLNPADFNRTGVGTHTLTVEVKLNGGSIWYSRAIEFNVTGN